MKRAFISDCEGPISKNDNAFELTSHFIPDGDKFFAVISKYDDVLADILKRSHYKAGNTLKLILPFLKAHGITDGKMSDFSVRNLVLVPYVKDSLKHIRNVTNAFIVSTSYEHHIKALCQAIGFPYDNSYCTKLRIDKYQITKKEKTKLKEIAKEIARMSVIEIPPKSKSIEDFSKNDQKTIQRLDEIFWDMIAHMESGRIFSEVNPIGGFEKAEAVKDVAQKVGISLADILYIGDSITDVEAFKLVKEKGGLAVSFNGNQYAIRDAEIAILSETGMISAVFADIFSRFGKQKTLRIAENWSREALEESIVNHTLLDGIFRLHPKKSPKVKIITRENMEILAKESCEFRVKVRGGAIGRLG